MKERRSASQLLGALLDFVAGDSALFASITDLDRADVVPVPGGAAAGANWIVRSDTNIDQHRPQIAREIRQLQARFDLDC